ncbi:MAG: hypothetical protein QXI37_03820, partial [Thermoprotei archaeon]
APIEYKDGKIRPLKPVDTRLELELHTVPGVRVQGRGVRMRKTETGYTINILEDNFELSVG